MEESLECLRRLLTEDTSSFAGKFFQYEGIQMYPKPVQKPLPIYIGGNSEKALERVAKHGAGWFPAYLSPQAIQGRLPRLVNYLEKESRHLNEIDIAPQLLVGLGRDKESATETFKRTGLYEHVVSLKASTMKHDDIKALDDFNLIGSPDDVVEKVKNYEAVGVTHLTGMLFAAQTLAEFEEQMEIFAKSVIPAFKKS